MTSAGGQGELNDPTDTDGPGAPPRANGELVFTESWQPRVFATTMRLREQGRLDWETFRQGLIGQIAAHEAELTHPDDYDYWGCWLRALEEVVVATEVVRAPELALTAQTLAARPPGHDHDHPH